MKKFIYDLDRSHRLFLPLTVSQSCHSDLSLRHWDIDLSEKLLRKSLKMLFFYLVEFS